MNAFRNDNFTISLVFDWLSRDDMENLKHILSDVESHLLDTGATEMKNLSLFAEYKNGL